MNTPTAIATYVFGLVVVVLIGVVINRMLRGWRHRAQRQADVIGTLPPVPGPLGPAVVPPTRGLYVGSVFAGNWLERINVGDLGYRCRAVLTRYPEGVLLERSGAGPIWMPQEAITAIRTDHRLAGKVLPGGRGEAGGGLLVIRWRVGAAIGTGTEAGTEIDTGFRGDDRRDYARWIGAAA